MSTECSRDLFGFGAVEGREVVAAFDGRATKSDAGALLLGATDRALGMIERFAMCFHDEQHQDLIEHEVMTLLGQRVFGNGRCSYASPPCSHSASAAGSTRFIAIERAQQVRLGIGSSASPSKS